MPTNPFLLEAAARGFIFQCTDLDALDAAMNAGTIAGYIGFDPTGDSLHVGHLFQIMMLRLLQRHGHRPVAVVGGGTAKIGDPSLREEARQLMDEARIAANVAGIRAGLDRLGYIELLRNVGPHFSVNRMLSFDSVKSRLDREQGLTFLEFNYSILQSYDFLELGRRHDVRLQMGGSDQWGNIVSGVDLVRRLDQRQVFGLTTPLLTTASGAKMGKTASGAVWLSAEKLPVFEYWQFWRNTEDADVGRFLRLFTELPLDEIARLDALEGAGINEAKKVLATEATALVHGRAAAQAAAETARSVFEGGAAAGGLPEKRLAGGLPKDGLTVVRAFVEAGLATSNGEARRLIRGGGARVNDAVVDDEAARLASTDWRDGTVKLSSGRKHHVLLRL
jgi:tyrosyl-tRNA synthetase